MTTDHEAEMWRAVAQNLHDYIARIRPECSCEETPEYQEFHRNYMLVPINQRIRYYLDNHPGEEVLNACEACSVMLQYELRGRPPRPQHHPIHEREQLTCQTSATTGST